MKFGLLGRKLGHSYSPVIHKKLGDYSYELFEREPGEIEDLIKRSDIHGLNVTIPYKEEVMKYCDEIRERASSIGCVNTIFKTDSGKIIGDNTDYAGFEYILDRNSIETENKTVLILGNGATSKTVAAVLKDRNAKVVKLGRSTSPSLKDIYDYADADIIVNTTPVGMYPNNLESLVDLKRFSKLTAVLDVVYNPMRTKLILDARKLGIVNSDGLPMLVVQAVAATEIFQNKNISNNLIEEIITDLRRETGNIVLVGMPGSGKSTIGRLIAEKSGKVFIDTDELIEQKSGMVIPLIFEKYGEEHFRKLEIDAVREAGKKTGCVISTGGGVVTRMENYEPLIQNGRVYFIERDLQKLSTGGRPLSKDMDAVNSLWENRKDLYEFFSDKSVNNTVINETAESILEDFYENIAD
ncbi:shikimate kinase [Microaceticoccus formicicus]|uniref:shikimate kinase n=1 Tax=Microaceticoccus formicicus TaxID=3118105 RepID=UPI003CCFF809|nr:shikimate kinase [Peptoniphilaceae bacterium AMB_02]